jgi:hypothetical protein
MKKSEKKFGTIIKFALLEPLFYLGIIATGLFVAKPASYSLVSELLDGKLKKCWEDTFLVFPSPHHDYCTEMAASLIWMLISFVVMFGGWSALLWWWSEGREEKRNEMGLHTLRESSRARHEPVCSWNPIVRVRHTPPQCSQTRRGAIPALPDHETNVENGTTFGCANRSTSA